MPVKQRDIRSDLTRIDKLQDEDIDYSDIRELDDLVFAQRPFPGHRNGGHRAKLNSVSDFEARSVRHRRVA